MTTDPDELKYLRIMLEKKRKQYSYWVWPDRPVKERGIASDILKAGVNVAGMCSRERGKARRIVKLCWTGASPIGLSNEQLDAIFRAARPLLRVEDRDGFLEDRARLARPLRLGVARSTVCSPGFSTATMIRR
jgi:hypothetical protein